MKTLNIKYIVFVAVMAFGTVGCNKQLNQVNPNQQTASTFWQTSSDAIAGLNAAYGSLTIDGSYMRFTPAMLDIRGDDVRSNSPWTALYNIGRFALGTAD